jgi:hypothetical protein
MRHNLYSHAKGNEVGSPNGLVIIFYDRLVYFEVCPDVVVAIAREKQIKGWSRKKKDDVGSYQLFT